MHGVPVVVDMHTCVRCEVLAWTLCCPAFPSLLHGNAGASMSELILWSVETCTISRGKEIGSASI
eukprot:1402743-Pleurochrysis_carterae.AAC.1